MNQLRKFALIASLALLFIGAGCERTESGASQTVIVTTDALHEIVSAVVGDRFEATNLLSGGEEIHHFEPTARDAEALAGAALIIYNGHGLDDWAAELAGKTTTFAVTSEMTGLIEGDPHVWLSPAYAGAMADALCQRLTELDPDGADVFDKNCAAFRAELQSLSSEFQPKFAAARLDTFVTGHAALGYLAAEFGLTQKSVSDVFSSGEPTAKQLIALADFCNANGVKYVLSESSAPLAVSRTLADECGAEVLSVYMMESVEDGLSFLTRMRHNLETLLKAVE